MSSLSIIHSLHIHSQRQHHLAYLLGRILTNKEDFLLRRLIQRGYYLFDEFNLQQWVNYTQRNSEEG